MQPTAALVVGRGQAARAGTGQPGRAMRTRLGHEVIVPGSRPAALDRSPGASSLDVPDLSQVNDTPLRELKLKLLAPDDRARPPTSQPAASLCLAAEGIDKLWESCSNRQESTLRG